MIRTYINRNPMKRLQLLQKKSLVVGKLIVEIITALHDSQR